MMVALSILRVTDLYPAFNFISSPLDPFETQTEHITRTGDGVRGERTKHTSRLESSVTEYVVVRRGC